MCRHIKCKRAAQSYPCVVERGVLARIAEYHPAARRQDLYRDHGRCLGIYTAQRRLRPDFEARFQTSVLSWWRVDEALRARRNCSPSRWCEAGADRSSVVIALGGGIANDMGGFLASIFMRGIPVIQIPTTLAGAGGCGDRRKDRCESSVRKESDRNVPSAARGLGRS